MCPVHFQWGQIANSQFSYHYNHGHVFCYYLHNYKIFLVYKLYKIKNITIFIFDPMFLICFRIILIMSKYQNFISFTPNILQGSSSKFKQLSSLLRVISLSATVCVYVILVWMWNVSSQYIQLLFYNLSLFLGFFFFLLYFLSNGSMFICCPVLLGNEWKQYAKVWTVSSWIFNCGMCDEWLYIAIYISITRQMQERLVEPGMGYDWAILVSLTKICMCQCWIRELQYHSKFSDLVVWPDDVV